MKILIDAQLSPALGAWINKTFPIIEAYSARSVGLRDSTDVEIYDFAKSAKDIIMSKDSDFIQLIRDKGSPPYLLWITCGNTSNRAMKRILSKTLGKAISLIEKGEQIVEISDKS